MVITPVNTRGREAMEIRIRKGTRKDHPMIWRATLETLWNDIPEDERRTLDRGVVEAHFRPRAQPVIEGPGNEILVAEDARGTVLGYTIVGAASSMITPNPFGFVYDLWVAPEARRHGIARRLMEAAEAWCRRQGYRRLRLETAAANAGARAFYAAIGFREERMYLGKPL